MLGNINYAKDVLKQVADNNKEILKFDADIISTALGIDYTSLKSGLNKDGYQIVAYEVPSVQAKFANLDLMNQLKLSANRVKLTASLRKAEEEEKPKITTDLLHAPPKRPFWEGEWATKEQIETNQIETLMPELKDKVEELVFCLEEIESEEKEIKKIKKSIEPLLAPHKKELEDYQEVLRLTAEEFFKSQQIQESLLNRLGKEVRVFGEFVIGWGKEEGVSGGDVPTEEQFKILSKIVASKAPELLGDYALALKEEKDKLLEQAKKVTSYILTVEKRKASVDEINLDDLSEYTPAIKNVLTLFQTANDLLFE